jgi:hypothetical protein
MAPSTPTATATQLVPVGMELETLIATSAERLIEGVTLKPTTALLIPAMSENPPLSGVA